MKIKNLLPLLLALCALGFSSPAHASPNGAWYVFNSFENNDWSALLFSSTGSIDQHSTTWVNQGTYSARFSFSPGPAGQFNILSKVFDIANATNIWPYISKTGPRSCIVSAHIYSSSGFVGEWGANNSSGTTVANRPLNIAASPTWQFINFKLLGTSCTDQLTVWIENDYPGGSGFSDAAFDSLEVDWQWG